MKKYFCFIICAFLLLSGCGTDYGSVYGTENDPNMGMSVFDTEKEIIDIDFYTSADNIGSIEISDEQLDEMTEWLGTIVISRAAGDTWIPGGYYTTITVYYADGTTFESSPYDAVVDELKYYTSYGELPHFLHDILYGDQDNE